MQCECNQLPSGTFDHVCIVHSELVSMEMEAAVLAEREACAKIADCEAEIAEDRGDLTAKAIAAAIRARGTT